MNFGKFDLIFWAFASHQILSVNAFDCQTGPWYYLINFLVVVVTLQRVPTSISTLLSTFVGKRGIFTHFPKFRSNSVRVK